jgi:hypothetical protein
MTFILMLAACIGCGGNLEQPAENNSGFSLSPDNTDISASHEGMATASAGSTSQVVTVNDQGLQMPFGQYTLPAGWQCSYDVATNPQDGQMARHQVDFFSAKNQLVRNKGMRSYYNILGITFDQQLQKLVNEGTADVSQLQFGKMVRNQQVMNDPEVQNRLQSLLQQGTRFEQLEIPFTGVRNGQAIQGKVDISHFSMPDQSGQIMGGNITVRIVMSTPELFAGTNDIAGQLDRSFRPNPGHGQMVSQIMAGVTRQIDANTAANTRGHEQRMADMQDNFNAHQQRMSGMQQSFDQQNQQWMDNQRGTGGNTTGDGYGSHEQFIDQVYERSTLSDPSSGFNVHQEGQHNYWYTDGQGHYHGTDDINFDPSTLGNEWYQTEPIKP